jgi:soluble lytic murein transglycosylase-like protein
MKKAVLYLSAIAALLIWDRCLFGQALYSYLDENGTRVFTNIAPTSPVADLKITGEVPAPPPAPAPAPTPAPSNSKSEAYDSIIEKYASDYHLDPSLIKSIIATESGFNPKAVSPKGARGLMQLMPATAEQLGVSNSFDPEQNIQAGVKHLRSLMDSFNDDISLSLAAYNAGETRVQRLGKIPPIKETQNYVQSVTKLYEKSKSEPKQQAPQQAQQEEKLPLIFRFVDDSGVLQVTNIPPLR